MRVLSNTPGRSVALATAFSSLLLSGSAHSSGPAGATTECASHSTAAQHFDAGIAARKAGQWDAAYAEFSAAWALSRHPRVAASLGQAELEVGKYRDAAEHLSYFLRQAVGASAADRDAITSLFLEARAKIGALRIRADDPGVEVLVDGVVVGTTPLVTDVFVDPGRRTITARKQGFAFVSEAIEVAPGDAVREMRIQERRQETEGVVPGPGPVPRPGPGQREGALEWRPWAIGGGAILTTAGLVAGIGMTARANYWSREADEQWASLERQVPQNESVCTGDRTATCGDVIKKRENQDEVENAAKAGFVVGGVALAATLAVVFWPEKRGQRASVMVLPAVGSGESGVRVLGSF